METLVVPAHQGLGLGSSIDLEIRRMLWRLHFELKMKHDMTGNRGADRAAQASRQLSAQIPSSPLDALMTQGYSKNKLSVARVSPPMVLFHYMASGPILDQMPRVPSRLHSFSIE
jgi:hypothetical protein